MNSSFYSSHPSVSIQDFPYCNIEISPCKRVLVVNGNKQGIDHFYQQCREVSFDSTDVLLQPLCRRQRRWHSWGVQINPNPLVTDPSAYHAICNVDTNQLASGLRIRFHQTRSPEMIFYGILEKNDPILIVNKKGWEQFLDMLLYLRDHSKWFYVVPKNPLFTQPLRFDYCISKNQSSHSLLSALECIRLEPEEEVKLYTCLNRKRLQEVIQEKGLSHYSQCGYLSMEHTIRGTAAGLLYLSLSLRNFVAEKSDAKDLLNPWDPNHRSSEPNWIHLRRVDSELNQIILSFQTKVDDQNEFYIFANEKGLIGLADIIEKYAFRFDSDHFIDSDSPLHEGDLIRGRWGGSDFYPVTGWYLKGGAFQSPLYNPTYFEGFKKTFINEKVIVS